VTVDRERWTRIESIFQGALALAAGSREDYLASACGDDGALRRDVERLLTASDAVGDRFERLIDGAAAELSATDGEEPDLEPGHEIGAFRIVRLLGRGGMGAVYLADQTAPLRRRVALKMLRRAQRDPAAVERMEAEAQALARMSHPAIAQIYDVATTSGGHVYLVMELVDGEPVTAYCDRHRLGVNSRLELGASICRAVQHAHDRGVLHRDLKPSNLLVVHEQGRPHPKVIDFGIAAALEEAARDAAEPGGQQRYGTPAFMSPEAYASAGGGLPADARSDVYSLGVVLFELLAGVLPWPDRETLLAQRAEGRRAPAPGERFGALEPAERERIAKARRSSPRGLDHRLTGELDRLVGGAIATDRTSRPASAGALADRIDGHLERAAGRGRRRSWSSRARWASALGALAVASILALLAPRFVPGGADRGARGAIGSVAVLPFASLHGDEERELFTDGITEDLIADLARIRSLRVISRTSAMTFRDSELPLSEIARRLEVDAVVEGSVAWSGDRLRINARLVDAGADSLIWTGTWERPRAELRALQRQVARAVADELRPDLPPKEEARLAVSTAVDPAAHELYLRGRYLWNRRSEESLLRAIEQFEAALRIEPGYARAHAGVADCYALLTPWAGRAPEQTYPRARAAALAALALDDGLAEAWTSLALVQHEYDWDWPAAEASYRRALDLNPGYATAHQWYAELLSRAGRHEEALAEIARARELDPLSLIVNAVAGWAAYNARRYEDAIAQLTATLELDPRFAPAEGYLGTSYLGLGDPAAARRHYQRALELAPDNPRYVAELGVAAAAGGDPEAARQTLARLRSMARETPVHGFHLARLHAALGEPEAALDALEDGYRQRGVWMLLVGTDLLLDPLREEPRFQDLVRRIDRIGTER
jgi:serine/threonine protein kinase/TolB-like protein/Tfp pilus assembly protein PilF